MEKAAGSKARAVRIRQGREASRGASGTLLLGTLVLAGAGLLGCGGDGDGDGSMMEPPPTGTLPPPPPPGASLALEPGQARVLRDPREVRSFQLAAADGAREYFAVVHGTGEGPGSLSLNFRARGPEGPGVGGSVAAALRPSRIDVRKVPVEVRASLSEARLKENMRRELRRLQAPRFLREGGGRGGRRAGPAARLSVSGARQAPRAGDTLQFTLAVQPDLNVDCADTTNVVVGVVRDVGQGVAIVEDTAVATDGQPAMDYGQVNATLDRVSFPVDSAYFGAPADIDDNERILALFTAEVNGLTPRNGDGAFIGGFFFAGDLLPGDRPTGEGGCPASNEAELVYILAPDPEGRFSDAVSVERAQRNAANTVTHEMEHLLSAQQRVILGNAPSLAFLEETWLDEGLAHLAEEVAGLADAGFGTRENLGGQQALGSQAAVDAFNTFHSSNFVRLGFHLQNPSSTLAFGNPPPMEDPGGEESLKMRGNAWMFLRWLADRFAPPGAEGIVPGSAEEELFRELSRGGANHLTGIDNVLQAVQTVSGESPTWEDLLAEFEAALVLDDNGPASLPPGTQVLTWNLRDLFRALNRQLGTSPPPNPFAQPFPLQPTAVTMTATAVDTLAFDLNAFTGRYFRLTSQASPAPDIFVEVFQGSAPNEATPPSTVQVTVVRTR